MDTFDHRSGQHLEMDGARIYYEVRGSESDPPLLLLHGGVGDIEDFAPVVARLAGRHRLIGIDSRGHGRSTLGTSPLSYAVLQRDVARITAHLGLSRYGVIGFSDGGIVGLRLACSTPSGVERLVVIGASESIAADADTRKLLGSVTGESWRKKFPGMYAKYQALNPEPDFDAFIGALTQMWTDTSERGYPGAAVAHVTCPLLVIRGDDDHLVSRAEAVGLTERVRGAHLLNVPFAGHEAHKDQADLVMRGLNTFLAASGGAQAAAS